MARMKQEEIKVTELQVLKGTLELFQDRSKWSQGFFAADSVGAMCSPHSDEAKCFCLMGGIRKVAGKENPGIVISCVSLIQRANNIENIPHWNDNTERQHSNIINALQKTIEGLE